MIVEGNYDFNEKNILNINDLYEFLYFKKGDLIKVTKKDDSGWWFGYIINSIDDIKISKMFPSNYIKELKSKLQPKTENYNILQYNKNEIENKLSNNNNYLRKYTRGNKNIKTQDVENQLLNQKMSLANKFEKSKILRENLNISKISNNELYDYNKWSKLKNTKKIKKSKPNKNLKKKKIFKI